MPGLSSAPTPTAHARVPDGHAAGRPQRVPRASGREAGEDRQDPRCFLDHVEQENTLKILEALRVDGKLGYGVLCYGVFSLGELDGECERLKRECRDTRWLVFRLFDDAWSHGVLLVEGYVDSVAGIVPCILDGFERMHSAGACLTALCMYDAAFPGHDDLFLPETARQTYAFCVKKGEPVIVMDSAVIVSEAWRDLVGSCRQSSGDSASG